MAIHNFVFGGAIAFLLGVAAASLGWGIYTLLGVSFVLGLLALILLGRLNLWKILVILAAILFIGFFYYFFYLNVRIQNEKIIFNDHVSFSGIVSGEPRGFEKHQIIDIRLTEPFKGNVKVFASPLSDLQYGDYLNFEGQIFAPISPADDSLSFFPKIEIVERNKGFWIKEKLLVFKGALLGQFQRILSADQAALLGGVTFGSRSSFSENLRNKMALSGTTHLVALSGYNIAILVIAVAYAIGNFVSRRKTFYLTAIIIFLFVMMVGAEASVVRAAIMGFLALLAREVGRVYSMRNSIALTAAAMTVVDPTILIQNIGFQLSFMSLLGIVYLAPALKKFFGYHNSGFAAWRENAVITLSAQLAVIPIVIQAFGGFSLTAIIANVLILEFMPLTMFLGFLLAAVSSMYSYLGFLLSKLVGLLLAYEIGVIKFFAELRLPVGVLPYGEKTTTFLYYVAIVIFIYYFSKRTVNKIENGKN